MKKVLVLVLTLLIVISSTVAVFAWGDPRPNVVEPIITEKL